MTAQGDLKQELSEIQHGIQGISRVLDAVAQLLRDAQVSQAGADRLTTHTRQQILKALDELRTWSGKAEHTICEVQRRVSVLESDHDTHDGQLSELLELMHQHQRIQEELFGLRQTLQPSPLARNINEIQQLIRKLADRDPGTGEPLDGFRVFLSRMRLVFWMALATAFMGFVLYNLTPFLPWKKVNEPRMHPGQPIIIRGADGRDYAVQDKDGDGVPEAVTPLEKSKQP